MALGEQRMVTIPTARDVAYADPRSGRIANAGPTPMVGAAMMDAGQAVVQASYSLLDLAEREKIAVANDRSNAVSTSLTRFLADEEQRFLKAREDSSESGIGFTRQFMEGHQQRANDFAKANFEGLTQDAQTGYLNNILSRGNSLYEKADEYERNAKGAYYDRTTNRNLDSYRTQIKNNAADFVQLKRAGLEAINSTDMPEPWKAARRQQWEADAAESKWRWTFQQDPAAAVSQMRAPVGGRVGRAYQRLIAKGWAPHQAAGIVGNLQAESGVSLNTQARNAGDGSDGSDSIGIAQWNGKRAQALKAFAASQGTDWHDFDTQIDFIDHELRTSERAAGENLARSTNAEDAAAAFTGYERPAGWSASNARGAHNWTGRRDNALRIAGENPQAEDADLDKIPYDRRDQLASWGETEHSQQVTRQRATTKQRYNDLIATEPDTVRESVILADATLESSDKADLVTTLRVAQQESGGVNAMIGALAGGKVDVDSFDSDQTSIADKTYDKLFAAAEDAVQQNAITSEFVARTGYIPKSVQADIRKGVASTDPATFAAAMSKADTLEPLAPVSFGAFEGGAQAREKLGVFRHMVVDLGLSGEEAATRILAASDPLMMANREVLKTKAARFIKYLSVSDVTSSFDPGWLSSAPGAGIVPQQPNGLLAEYREIAEEKFYEYGGDAAAAKAAALTDLKRRWNVSNVSGSPNLMRMPPELHYPAIGGSLDYLREDAMKTASDYAAKLGRKVENVAILASDKTRADIEAKRPPRYRLFYQYTSGGQTQFSEVFGPPWGVDAATFKRYSDKLGKLSMAERARQDAASDATRAGDAAAMRALEATVGPDWMKARAAEAARELGRSQSETIRKRPLETPAKPTFDPEKLPITFGHAMNDAMWSDDAAD
jgi:hypothetical protein